MRVARRGHEYRSRGIVSASCLYVCVCVCLFLRVRFVQRGADGCTFAIRSLKLTLCFVPFRFDSLHTHTHSHTHILANVGGSSKDEYKLAQSGDATCNGLDSAEVISDNMRVYV